MDKEKKVNERTRKPVPEHVRDQVGDHIPLAGVYGLKGVRVHHVGQGDGIAVIDTSGRSVFHIDYGGHQKNPFKGSLDVDARMPVDSDRLVMLTHWDQDHWCTANRGTRAKAAQWLVPRQVTSPSAVKFATELDTLHHIACIPESEVGIPHRFEADNGDEIWWEKLAKSETDAAKYEDCNSTGVAFSIVKRSKNGKGQVILLPGDAPFHKVDHYHRHSKAKLTLTGIVAYHHGSNTHWTDDTYKLLLNWPRRRLRPAEVIFSCGKGNSYQHPCDDNYITLFGDKHCRRTYNHDPYIDIDFA